MLIWIGAAAIVVAALVYALSGRKRRVAPPAPHVRDRDPALDAFAAAGDERPTEDQIARARLGGPRGAPELGQAPLSPQAREQTPRKIDDGHVA
jgi:hypothetical protein